MMDEVRVGHEKANLTFGEPIDMRDDFTPLTQQIAKIEKPILFFNIGSERVSGDAFGPMLGTFLVERGVLDEFDDVAVMGTLEHPIHARNLEEKMDEAKYKYGDYVWIASDACLGRAESVGKVTFAEGMVTPGAGIDRMLPPVGDYSLTAVVNVGGFMEYFILGHTSLWLVYSLASRCADAIIAGLRMRREMKNVAVGTETIEAVVQP